MPISLEKFVRTVTAIVLRPYFEAREIDIRADWHGDEKAAARQVIDVVYALADPLRSQILTDFERANEMADEVGQNALIGAMTNRAAALEAFGGMSSPQERALWVFCTDLAAFERAEDARYIDYGRQSRMWDGFLIPRDCEIDRSEQARHAFAQSIREHLAPRDGSGRTVKIEVFDRARVTGDVTDPLVQVMAYVEGMAVSTLSFDDGELVRRLQRPPVEVAFAYSPATGALDVVAKGGRNERRALARLLLKHLLATELDPEQIPLRIYRLNNLARRQRFPTDDEDHIKSVRVLRLRLKAGNGGRVTIESGEDNGSDIWETSRQWFDDKDPLANGGFAIQHAKLSIEFRPSGSRKSGKKLPFEISVPNGCTLKDRTERERLIGEKYLSRWQLVVDD